MKIFIPIKKESIRVPNKNYRDFGGQPLWRHTLLKFSGCKIFVDTDDLELINIINNDGELKNVCAYERRKDYVGNDISVNKLIDNFLNMFVFNNETIVQLHVTSPFLLSDTLVDAFQYMDVYKSVCGANKVQSRLWENHLLGWKPVNHDPSKLIPTQDLPQIFEENSSFYMFTKNSYIENNNNRISNKNWFQLVNFPQNLDIDTEDDWNMCVKLWEAGVR